MNISNSDLKSILRHLSDGKWHTIYSLHERFRLNPNVIISSIEYLKEKKAIDIEQRNIRLVKSLDEKFMDDCLSIYSNNPINLDGSDSKFTPKKVHQLDELYMPRLDLLGKELLPDEK